MDNRVVVKARNAYEMFIYKTILKTEMHMALHSVGGLKEYANEKTRPERSEEF
jgi:hypothetical protein